MDRTSWRARPYQYQHRVSREQIRLLKPASTAHGELSFQVVKVPRSEKPNYTAISYTWGDEAATKTIFLDNRVFRVRKNLWLCLEFLTRPSRSWRGKNWTYVWVDAVCINQSDTIERNEQVRSMHETYRQASCVTVWLGAGITRLPPDHTGAILDETVDLSSETSAGTRVFEASLTHWTHEEIPLLAECAYWTRLWVVQEFFLAADVRIHWLNIVIDWQDFRGILASIRKQQPRSPPNYGVFPQSRWDRQQRIHWEARRSQWRALPRAPGSGVQVKVANRSRALPPAKAFPSTYAASALLSGRHEEKYPRVLQPLYTLLIEHRQAQCRDPRDRVFALLGLIPAGEQELLLRYLPDYDLPQEHVAIITLSLILQAAHSAAVGSSHNVRITQQSDRLFEALGLGHASRPRRRRLLERAAAIDLGRGPSSPRSLDRTMAIPVGRGLYGRLRA
ncbi:HET domain-containing protein [Microdochium nivale]|nr:HET domain-containing protein [Microdochium nivale]